MAQSARKIWTRSSDDQEDLVSDTNDDNTHGEENEHQEEQFDGNPAVYTSQWATLFIIVNVTVGVGLLAMPYAMQSTGIVVSMLVQLVFLVLIIITCIICTELTVKSAVNSYHQIILKHCHPYVYQITQVSIFFLVFGTTVTYIVTIGDQTDRLFATLYGPTFCHSWYMNRKIIMSFLTFVAIKPLCSARTVDFLKYASFLGIVSIGFIFYVVLAEFVHQKNIGSDVNYYPKSWVDVISVLPMFCLGYQCHLSLVPTVATIHRREKHKAFATTTIAMIVAAVIYSTISILAVMTFGSKIEKDLTESYQDKNWVTMTTIGIVAVKCILTLPAAYLPARLSIIDILANNWGRFAQFSEPIRRVGVTLVFLDLALLLALTVPDIIVAVNILGFLAVMFIFQLPGLAYLNLIKQNRLEKQQAAGLDHEIPIYTSRDKMKFITSYFLLFFGCLMTVVVLYKSITGIMESTPSPPLCHN